MRIKATYIHNEDPSFIMIHLTQLEKITVGRDGTALSLPKGIQPLKHCSRDPCIFPTSNLQSLFFCTLYYSLSFGALTKYNSLETWYVRNTTTYFLTHISGMMDVGK